MRLKRLNKCTQNSSKKIELNSKVPNLTTLRSNTLSSQKQLATSNINRVSDPKASPSNFKLKSLQTISSNSSNTSSWSTTVWFQARFHPSWPEMRVIKTKQSSATWTTTKTRPSSTIKTSKLFKKKTMSQPCRISTRTLNLIYSLQMTQFTAILKKMSRQSNSTAISIRWPGVSYKQGNGWSRKNKKRASKLNCWSSCRAKLRL